MNAHSSERSSPLTRRWREQDSNPWSLSRIRTFPGLSRVTSSLRHLPRPRMLDGRQAKVSGRGWTPDKCGALIGSRRVQAIFATGLGDNPADVGCGCGSPLATPTCGSTLATNIMPLEFILRAVEVHKPLERIRAQGEVHGAERKRQSDQRQLQYGLVAGTGGKAPVQGQRPLAYRRPDHSFRPAPLREWRA
jgi:hypothetical protein